MAVLWINLIILQILFFVSSKLQNGKLNLLKDKTVMAHRGVWGYFPEHSIRGFELAYFMGADYLESDVNMTKDGQLVVFHDAYLDDATNVNNFPEYTDRRKNAIVDGLPVENKLFVSDFTFEEIQRLFLKQRISSRPQTYNNDFKVILLEDLIKMLISYNKFHNKSTGLYIEPKCPDYYENKVNEKIFDLLSKYNLTGTNSLNYSFCPVVIQSFEYQTLEYFKERANLPQVALMRWRMFYNMKKLAEVSDGFGPDADFVLYERIDDFLLANGTKYDNVESYKENVLKQPFKDTVEALGKKVLGKNDNEFVNFARILDRHVQIWNINNDAPKFSLDASIEYAKLAEVGVNAFFSDFCHTALFAMKFYKNISP